MNEAIEGIRDWADDLGTASRRSWQIDGAGYGDNITIELKEWRAGGIVLSARRTMTTEESHSAIDAVESMIAEIASAVRP